MVQIIKLFILPLIMISIFCSISLADDFEQSIQDSIAFIEKCNVDGRFDKNLEWLSDANITKKHRFSLFKKSSTTWGPHKIKVKYKWDDINQLSKSLSLTHEAKHLDQYRRMGGVIPFLFSYMQASGRTRIELGAYRQSIKWYITTGHISKDSAGRLNKGAYTYIEYLTKVLLTQYKLEGKKSSEELKKEITNIIFEETAKYKYFAGCKI